MRLLPARRRVAKLRHLPAVSQLLKTRRLRLLLDPAVFARHDHVAKAQMFDLPDEFAGKISGIGAQPNPCARKPRRHFRQTPPQKVHDAGVARCVARSQRAVPELLPLRLETQQRMIRAAPALLRVVADARSLLVPVEREHHRVHIEDQTTRRARPTKQFAAQLIVQADQPADGGGREPLEKPAQGRLIGELLQPQQREEGAVVLEHIGLVEATQSRDDGEQQRQDQVGGEAVAAPVRQREGALKSATQMESLTKTLNQHHASEVSQVRLVERKPHGLQSFSHGPVWFGGGFDSVPITYLKGRLLAWCSKSPIDYIRPAFLRCSHYQFTLF